MSRAEESVLLYDEDCGFCKWSLNKILVWDRARRIRPVAIQSAEGNQLLAELDPTARLGSWHFVDRDGTLFSAGAAAEPLVRLLPGGRPLAAIFSALPGATERTYRLIARNRDRLAKALRIKGNCQVRR